MLTEAGETFQQTDTEIKQLKEVINDDEEKLKQQVNTGIQASYGGGTQTQNFFLHMNPKELIQLKFRYRVFINLIIESRIY